MHVSQAVYFLATLASTQVILPLVDRGPQFTSKSDGIRVPVELGVMSRCPDALACETIFNDVLNEVGRERMDLSLVYVANLNSTDVDFGATCKHGPTECAGNVQQLCAAKYANPGAWWDFVQCQNSHGRYQVGLPDVALQCAELAGINWESSGVGSCAGSDASGKAAEGIELLHESLLLGKALKIEKSCTVLIDRKKVCVRDDTWKECDGGHGVDDFVRQINREWDNLNRRH
ncbi:hypothetical protein C8R47DRAFT_1130511 [Mycena vitilis]|nr:hypothetical protein C8R47DRAFT_1130511 [Mycena vitilis]